jgi:predicted CoA-binding protein
MSLIPAAEKFLSTPTFAVIGASTNTAKYGYKVLAWYTARSLPVIPINPTASSITTPDKTIDCVKSVKDLPDPKNTALSIITPPKVSLQVLKEAKQIGVSRVWFQPGAFDQEVLDYAKGEGAFESVIAGMEGGTRGGEGWCVLVDGDAILHKLGRIDGKL